MKTKYLKIFSIAFASSVVLASCSQDFLEEKKNYDQVQSEIYDVYEGADYRVRDVYARCLPNGEATFGENWQYVSWGIPDNLSRATEEYVGSSSFTDYNTELSARGSNKVPDYFMNSAGDINGNPYGLIRHINEAIQGISGGKLSQEDKNKFLGQLYFFRAWRYFILWKWYGGVPLIDYVPVIGPDINEPRASAKRIFDFIIKDLDEAADLLEPFTSELTNTTNYGRITTGAALALKGRVLAWWCSPLFNRAQDSERYQTAYETAKADLERINACGYGLNDATTKNAAGWADMFQYTSFSKNTEGVFIARFNNLASVGDAIYRNNMWERYIRPYNASCAVNSANQPALDIIDIFPMADGKVPNNNYYKGLSKSSYEYKIGTGKLGEPGMNDHSLPFLNRDPRFYRTFAFAGIKWPVKGEITWNSNAPYPKGNDYELWNYVWYDDVDQRDNWNSGTRYGADFSMDKVQGVNINKRSGSTLDTQEYTLSQTEGFRWSGASLMEIRYAEVLLNLAELAAGANKTGEAYEYLRQIRRRVGYTGDCGITEGGQGDCMAAVLYERQIELAFEGKRFDDMRRWLLFDGGSDIPGTKLTGWSGNTCTWLNVAPFNGRRRESMEFRVNNSINNGLGGSSTNSKAKADAWTVTEDIPDPIAQVVMAEQGWTNSADNTIFDQFKKWRSENYAVDLNAADLNAELTKLKGFYDKYLVFKHKKGDSLSVANEPDERTVITFRPYYYFLGLQGGAMDSNPTLRQTIGWDGGPTGEGDFDPLAE